MDLRTFEGEEGGAPAPRPMAAGPEVAPQGEAAPRGGARQPAEARATAAEDDTAAEVAPAVTPVEAGGPAPASPRPAGKGPGKRQRLLRAAAELFAEKDYHKVLTDEVAQRAKVGKGTLYRYFQNKQDLFVAVLSYAVDLTAERLRTKLEKVDDPVRQLRVATKQALRFFRENDHLFRVLNQEKSLRSTQEAQELKERRKALRHFAEDILIEGRERGAFDVEDAGFASTILWGMIRTALRTEPKDVPLEDISRRIVDLFANGARARGVPPADAGGRADP